MIRVAVIGAERDAAVEAIRGRCRASGLVVERVASWDAEMLAEYQLVVAPGTPLGAETDAPVDHWLGTLAPLDIEGLCRERLEPWAVNLAAGKRAPRRRTAVLFPSNPAWTDQAARLLGRLRWALGDRALRLDHIGSTSVPGLAAKDLIDLQVVVRDLREAEVAAEETRRAGFVPVGEILDIDRHGALVPEQCAVDADPGRPVNVHIRPLDSPVWRETLLLRDWLREHPDGRAEYETLKRALAERPGSDVDAYSDDKMPWIQSAIGRADQWAREAGRRYEVSG